MTAPPALLKKIPTTNREEFIISNRFKGQRFLLDLYDFWSKQCAWKRILKNRKANLQNIGKIKEDPLSRNMRMDKQGG
jgi:hypothetical protein